MNVIIEVVGPRLLGPALMVAAAIVVKGYGDVGDGFSAGVIIALAVAIRYVALGTERCEQTLPILRHTPLIAVAGLLIVLAVGFFPVLAGDSPLSHEPGPGEAVTKVGTLELITPMLFDVGVCLLVAGVLVVLVHHLARLVDEVRA